jgi:hypothetical protein
MKLAAVILAWIALAIMLIAPLAVYWGAMSLATCKLWLLAGTAIWFASSPIAMKRRAH